MPFRRDADLAPKPSNGSSRFGNGNPSSHPTAVVHESVIASGHRCIVMQM